MKLQFAWALGFAALSLNGCAGNQKPAHDPEPTVAVQTPSTEDDTEKGVAPASSDAVKEGRNAIQAGNFQQAVEILATARQQDPEDAQAAFYYGVALEGAGNPAEAEAEYRRALELAPKLIEARANLSYLLLSQDEPKEALSVAEAGLEFAPKNPSLLANRALALDVLGKTAEALEAYEALLLEAPQDTANRFNYAVLLAVVERKDDAAEQLGKIQTEDVSLLSDVAQLYGRLKKYDACIATLDKAITQESSAELLVHRARCKHSAGDDKGAEVDLRASVDAEPNNPIGHYYLGRHMIASGHESEGEKHLEKALELGPDSPFGQAARRDLQQAKD